MLVSIFNQKKFCFGIGAGAELRQFCLQEQCNWPRGVMVSTLDSESSDPSSNLGGTYRILNFISNQHYAYFCAIYHPICVLQAMRKWHRYDYLTGRKVCARCGARTHDPGITRALVVSV